jgi:hypothetical protein
MGFYLKKYFGKAYYAMGFSQREGAFLALNIDEMGKGQSLQQLLKRYEVPLAPEGTLGWYLSLPGITDYIIDFKDVPLKGIVADWLMNFLPIRQFGGGFSTSWPPEEYTESIKLKDHFDAIIYIQKTSETRNIPYAQ